MKIIEILHHSASLMEIDFEDKDDFIKWGWHSKVARKLDERGYEVESWRPEVESGQVEENMLESVKYVTFPSKIFHIFRWDVELSKDIFRRLFSLRKQDIVLELHGAYNYQNVLTSIVFGGSFPVIIQTHGGKPMKFRRKESEHTLKFLYRLPQALEELAFCRADKVYCLKEDERDYISNFTEADFSPMGVNFDEFKPLSVKDEDKRVLAVSRLEPNKNIDMLMESLDSADYNGILDVIGDGPEFCYLQQKAKEVSYEVNMHGYVPNSKLPKWYSMADWSMIASEQEGYCMVAVESLATKTPFVSTSVGAMPRLVRNYQAGEVVGKPKVENLVEGIETVRKNEYSIDRTGAQEKLSWEKIIDKREKDFSELE